MREFPTLPVALLADGLIESGDYPDWRSTRRVITACREDREILADLLADIPVNGVLEPLTVGVWRPHVSFYLSDGHHRAIALKQLGITEFPYRWAYKTHGSHLAWAGREPLPAHLLEYLMEGAAGHA